MKEVTIALAGNPNAGKTTVFNSLTGAYHHVGNYPGVTVEKKWGSVKHKNIKIKVVDLPGTYSLTAYSLEELVARNFVVDERPDMVVHVVDASNLERNLYLALQFMEIGIPLIIVLNMVDLAESRGLKIDTDKLSKLLGVPVVPAVATKDRGMKELLDVIVDLTLIEDGWSPIEISYGNELDREIDDLSEIIQSNESEVNCYPPRWLAIKLLEQDEQVVKLMRSNASGDNLLKRVEKIARHVHDTFDDSPEGLIADHRYGYITSICREAVQRTMDERLTLSDRVDKVLINRTFGPFFLAGIIYLSYKFVFWASDIPVGLLENFFGLVRNIGIRVLPDGIIESLVINGMVDGVGGVLSFVPLIMLMFFAIAILEDSGYMARMAFLLDRLLRYFGLHGNSVLAMIVSGGISGGCAVCGVMATRTLKNPKERLATILVSPFMNCGAKLPIYALLIAAFFTASEAKTMFVITVISWSFALLAARGLRSTVLKGPHTPFVMELPPYRMPTSKGLLIHMWERTWHYLKKAGTIILLVSIIMWAISTFPKPPEELLMGLDEKERAQVEVEYSVAGRIGKTLERVTDPLGFDWRINIALVGGFAAKEVVVATLGTVYSMGEMDPETSVPLSRKLQVEPGWNPLRAFTLMLFCMLYAPCFVTLATIKSETGSWKWTGFAMIYTTVIAYVVSLVVFQAGRFLGIGL
ncbi:MAG: ferrous iron transport protein B [Thermodesulfobacteriota bacterium]|nr:ferrous iron transport protein B [Thermodesulfobacteriota bacterium]